MVAVSWWEGSVSSSSPDRDKLSLVHIPNRSAERGGEGRR